VAGLFPAVSISEENFAASEEDSSSILRLSPQFSHVGRSPAADWATRYARRRGPKGTALPRL